MSGRPAAKSTKPKAAAKGRARKAAPAAKEKEKKDPINLNNAQYNHSAARSQIAQDIIDEYIPRTGSFDSKDIYDTLYANDKNFKNFPYDKVTYDRRIESLRKGINNNLKEAMDDHDAVIEDLQKHPPKDKNIRGQLRWEGSAAEHLLEQDIKDKLHEGVSPEVLQATRNEYLLFDLKVFTKHIDQTAQALKTHHKEGKQHKRKKRHFGNKELSRKETLSDGNEVHQTKKKSLKSKLVAQSNK
jgi:hypothetical protein